MTRTPHPRGFYQPCTCSRCRPIDWTAACTLGLGMFLGTCGGLIWFFYLVRLAASWAGVPAQVAP